MTVPLNYDCIGNLQGTPRNSGAPARCEVTRRQVKPSFLHEIELDRIEEQWNNHKHSVKTLRTLRNKRFIPLLAVGAATAIISAIAGTTLNNVVVNREQSTNIEELANVTDIHTKLIQQATEFFDQYRESVQVLHSWAQDVEDRLGNESAESRLNNDPLYREKKAGLVKAYMGWFESQEKLLQDINTAAQEKKIPPILKTMVNFTQEIATKWSLLNECNYYLDNKNLVLNLDFTLPTLSEEIQILDIMA